VKNAFRTDIDSSQLMLIEYSFIAIMSLLLANKQPNLIDKYLKIFVQQFKNTGTISGEKRVFIQNGLLTSIQTCLLRYHTSKLDENLADEIYLMVAELFKLKGDVNSDGVHVIGGLASALGPKFTKYAQDFWQVLLIGLKRKNESELFSASLGALIEVSKSCPEAVADYLQEIFPYLLSCLHEATFDKNLKLLIVSAIGDISLGCKEKITPFVEDVLKIYNLAMEGALQLPANTNAEYTDYLEQLRDSVLESYICFVHAVEDSAKQDALIQHLPLMIDFLKKTCNETFNPTVDFLRNALALIGDVGNFFGARVRDLIKTDFTFGLMQVLNKFAKFEENQKILSYAQNVLNAL